MKKLRVLLLTRNLPPLLGGMESLNLNLALGLDEWAEVAVVGPEESGSILPPSVSWRGVVLRPLWRFLMSSTGAGARIALSWRPDIVIGGSGLMAPAVLAASYAANARSVLYVHGLDLTVPHWLYRVVWRRMICHVDALICNSRPTALLAEGIGANQERLHVVCPGVATPLKSAGIEQIERFRQNHGLGGRPLLLSVGRLTARKGLLEFVEQALPVISKAVPDVAMVIIGDAPSDALHAQPQTKEMILAAAQALGVARHLVFLGRVSDADLRGAYQAAGVHVFPVRDLPGDPEGFGMVAIEAAAHGLPTVAFRSGGVTDSVAEGRSGYLVEPDDYAQFAGRVCALLGNPDVLRESSIAFAQQFAWPRFNQKIRECLEQVSGPAPDTSSHTPPDVHP